MFAEMLKSDVEHLRVGDTTTTVRPCSAWPLPAAYSRESSHEYLKHLGTSTTRTASLTGRLRREVLVPLRKALELPEVYMCTCRFGELPAVRAGGVAGDE